MKIKEIFEVEFLCLTKEERNNYLKDVKYDMIREEAIAGSIDELLSSYDENIVTALLNLLYKLIRESQADHILESFDVVERDAEELGVETNDTYEEYADYYGEVSSTEYFLMHNGFRFSFEIGQPFDEWYGCQIEKIEK